MGDFFSERLLYSYITEYKNGLQWKAFLWGIYFLEIEIK